MKFRRRVPSVVTLVQDQTRQAAELARIDGQDRLTDPRTNPAVRPHADRLRNIQHREALNAEHARRLRKHRVEDRHAEYAEKALDALQEAREASSAAKSVLTLHARRRFYMRTSLFTSVALAGGSAMGLEAVAANNDTIPTGTGVISEVGLTGLATLVILARSDLAQHGGELKRTDWRNWALWTLMVVPLAASMAANIHGGNFLGALCASGAAAFSLFSYVVGVLFADAAKEKAAKVTGDDEATLRKIATGHDLFAVPTPDPVPTSDHKPSDHTVDTAPPVATSDSDHLVATAKPTPEPKGEHKPSDHTASDHKPVATPVPTGGQNAEPTPGAAPVATNTAPEPEPASPSPAKPAPKPAKKRRTRDEIRVELQAALKEHFDNGGGEIQVKPLAEKIGVNRRIVRELLDEMNVRPMVRKAVGE